MHFKAITPNNKSNNSLISRSKNIEPEKGLVDYITIPILEANRHQNLLIQQSKIRFEGAMHGLS
jgi:hypothetical protein